jgi:hypothetical protein
MLLTILSESISLIFILLEILLGASDFEYLLPILEYLISLPGFITADDDIPSFLSSVPRLLDLPDPTIQNQHPRQQRSPFFDYISSFYTAWHVGRGWKMLETDSFSYENMVGFGLLMVFLIPKSFIEGKIAFTVLAQGLKLLRRLMEYRRSRNVDSDVNGIVEKQEGTDSKNEVSEKV